MKGFFRRLLNGYVNFVEKQGFPIIVTICVSVIVATSLYVHKEEPAYVSPTPPVGKSISAAQLLQQSLQARATPTPQTTVTPRQWLMPVEGGDILRPFSAEAFHQGSHTGIWQLHDAIDLSCNPGDKVQAIAEGTIISSGKDELLGVWMHIDHGDGIQALYAGMALNGAYLPGDQVQLGATLGFAGKGPLDEQDLPPHLHLRVTREGRAIDPVTLWSN